MDSHLVLCQITWAILAILAIWQLLRWIPAGTDKLNPLPYVIALLQLSYIPLLLIAIISAAFNMKHECIASIIILLISFTSHTPYVFKKIKKIFHFSFKSKSNTYNHESTYNKKIRIMTLNCRYGRANAKQIVEIAKENNIDTLLLQEVNKQLIKKLHDFHIEDIFSTQQLGEESENDNGGFNAIFTKYSPQRTLDKTVNIDASNVPLVTTKIDDITLNFASAHPKSPMRGCVSWSEGIRILSKILKTFRLENSKVITIIAGDFNSTIDHPSFRKLLSSGLKDSAIELGCRLRTWPTWLRWPNFTLDHILFNAHNCSSHALSHKSIVVKGTDHLAYITCISFKLNRPSRYA